METGTLELNKIIKSTEQGKAVELKDYRKFTKKRDEHLKRLNDLRTKAARIRGVLKKEK
jgi:hypothetical protein